MTEPLSTHRILRRLRATLAAWGASAPELAAIDAWATWVMKLTRAAKDAGDATEVPVYTSLDTALAAALDVTTRVLGTASGVAEPLRRGVWLQGYAGNELVTTLLLARSQRATPPPAPAQAPAPTTMRAPTEAPRPTPGGARG